MTNTQKHLYKSNRDAKYCNVRMISKSNHLFEIAHNKCTFKD